MQRSTIVRTGTVGAVCALAGGAIGIAGSSASSPSRPTSPPVIRAARAFGPGLGLAGPMLGFGPLAGAAGLPVHSDTVVPNEKGGFDTVTMDRGMFSSLSGDQLTITEGTKSATYKTVTLTIPSNATVRRNGEKADLSDLKAGDEVLVVQSPNGTVVAAHDAQHQEPLVFKLAGPRRGEGPQQLKVSPPPPPHECPPGSTEKGSATEKGSTGSCASTEQSTGPSTSSSEKGSTDEPELTHA
jgi:hypothetical protein